MGFIVSKEMTEEVSTELGVDLTSSHWLHQTLPFTSTSNVLNIMYTIEQMVPDLPKEVCDKIFFAGPLSAARGNLAGDKSKEVVEMKELRRSGKKIWYISFGTVIVDFYGVAPVVRKFLDRLMDLILDILRKRPEIHAFCVFFNHFTEWFTENEKKCPENFHACPFISQLQVLTETDVFLTHGGCNSANEGMYSGVPMIVLPFFFDQFTNAKAIEDLGVGTQFPLDGDLSNTFPGSDPERSSVTLQSLEKALDFCLSNSVIQACSKISKQFREQKASIVVDMILEVIKASS